MPIFEVHYGGLGLGRGIALVEADTNQDAIDKIHDEHKGVRVFNTTAPTCAEPDCYAEVVVLNDGKPFCKTHGTKSASDTEKRLSKVEANLELIQKRLEELNVP